MSASRESNRNTLLLGRADWHFRANALVVLYMLAALISGALQKGSPGGKPSWVTVHLLLLGAVTNAIVTWSDHFVSALLWARSLNRKRQMTVVSLLNIGIIGVLVAVSHHVLWLVLSFAALICAVIVYHLLGMANSMKKSLNLRFKGVVAFYQFAGLALLAGIVLGVLDANRSDKDIWQSRIALAHLHANLLGWVGLTIIGTLVTLWPTVLRTQIHERAIPWAVFGLKVLAVGTIGSIAGFLSALPVVIAVSIAMYLFGVVVALIPCALLIRRRAPDRSSSWMLLTGVVGFGLLLIGDIALVIWNRSPEKILTALEGHLLLIFTLWLLPIFFGALTYLLPVVLSKGPTTRRKLESILDFGWPWRIVLLPLSSLLQILPDQFHIVSRICAAVALGTFILLVMIAMRTARSFIST